MVAGVSSAFQTALGTVVVGKGKTLVQFAVFLKADEKRRFLIEKPASCVTNAVKMRNSLVAQKLQPLFQ
jgi:hypothetical protein